MKWLSIKSINIHINYLSTYNVSQGWNKMCFVFFSELKFLFFDPPKIVL